MDAQSVRSQGERRGFAVCLCSLGLAVLAPAGCGSTSYTPAVAPSGPANYFGPAVSSALNRSTFTIDRTARTFIENQYLANAGNEQYVANSGPFTLLANGILNIGITYGGGTGLQGTLFNPPQTGNYAVEWPGQVGLVGLLNQPVVPIVPNSACPSFPSAQTFQYVTLPLAGDATGTAYGTVSITAAGGASGSSSPVSLSGITQFNIAGGAPTNPSAATVSAVCAPTFFGQTTSVPVTSIVTNPGNGQTQTPTATIAIGPTGFLVEDNGYTPNPVAFQNVLGSGTGAIGVAMPAAPLSTSALTAAQYTGFIYATGAAANLVKNLQAVAPATRIASFGYPNLQTACPTLPAAQTATVLYGGEFAGNNAAAQGFGNCDFAVDLGVQDATRHGLYPGVTVTLGASFPGNTLGRTYSFAGVAVAGQSNGKLAIFVIALDAIGLQAVSQGQQSQSWGVYLLQSN